MEVVAVDIEIAGVEEEFDPDLVPEEPVLTYQDPVPTISRGHSRTGNRDARIHIYEMVTRYAVPDSQQPQSNIVYSLQEISREIVIAPL